MLIGDFLFYQVVQRESNRSHFEHGWRSLAALAYLRSLAPMVLHGRCARE
jgi:hypothetical protein